MSRFSLSDAARFAHLISTRSALDGTSVNLMETVSVISTALNPVIRYLTNEEAAAFLKLSPRTLEKQRVTGGGPRFHKFGRRVVYAIEELESWASSRVCTSTSDVPVNGKR